MSSLSAGLKAETAVANYLVAKGFKILARNWKNPRAEIDIVATKHKTLYFIEVKYRSSHLEGEGFDYITSKKLEHMRRAADSWLTENDWQGECVLMAASVSGPEMIIDIRELA